MKETPKCPKCGAPMVMRVAKRGKNAGKPFWGCSNYPDCKGTRSHEEYSETDQKNVKQSGEYSFPRPLIARALFKNHYTKFFQASAVPYYALKNLRLCSEPVSRKLFSQWRMDYGRLMTEAQKYGEPYHTAFSVVEKALLRGNPTLVSPKLEEKFKSLFDVRGDPKKGTIGTNLFLHKSERRKRELWFDSEDEKTFYEQILPEALGESFERWVTSQVDLCTLCEGETEVSGRTDFLICVPGCRPTIVEIDGSQHESHKTADHERTALLEAHGYTVLRFSVDDIYEDTESIIRAIQSQTAGTGLQLQDGSSLSPEEKFILACKKSHQIQLTVLQSLIADHLDCFAGKTACISTDLHLEGVFNEEEVSKILEEAVEDFEELLNSVLALYSCKDVASFKAVLPENESDLHVSFAGSQKPCLTFFLQDCFFPFDLQNSKVSANPLKIEHFEEDTLEYFLNYFFRKPAFWEGQAEAVLRTLQGEDSLVLLPTGGGKSIAFQLAALLLPGAAIVIDPIISLMDDQLDNLSRVGIDKAIAINSQMVKVEDRQKALALVGQGEYVFVYVAPERFQTEEFRQALRGMTVHTPVCLVAIDEAHCVSEWGHDFRTSYLNIGRTTRKYCSSGNYVPPLLALTGTASRTVLKDVQRELRIEEFDAIITPKSFDRPELHFSVNTCHSSEKFQKLSSIIWNKLPSDFNVPFQVFFQQNGENSYSGLVFCPHVNGEYGVVQVADSITANLRLPASIYSGSAPKNRDPFSWNLAKKHIAKRYKDNENLLLVCTKAFGMGIDKPNIRYTVHYGLPQSIESFYQEAGRAGRDRSKSFCAIIVSNDNETRTKYLLDPNTPTDEILRILEETSWEDNDDVTRVMYFQTRSFPGISVELATLNKVIKQLGDLSKQRTENIVFDDLKLHQTEKALYRLVLLSIVRDYTINYSNCEFKIRFSGAGKEEIIEAFGNYVGNYQLGRKDTEIEKLRQHYHDNKSVFIERTLEALLRFIYDVIEKGRRQALSEMLDATNAGSETILRKRILHYLEATEYTEKIEKIITSARAGLDVCYEVFNQVRSRKHAEELRGQVARYLESYPDQPGLRMLRALSEAYSKDCQDSAVVENVIAAIDFAQSAYSIREEKVHEFLSWGLTKIWKKKGEVAEAVVAEIIRKEPKPELCRFLISSCGIRKTQPLAWCLLALLSNEIGKVLQDEEDGFDEHE